MSQGEKLVIFAGEGASADAVSALSRRVGAPVSERMGEELTLVLDRDGLSLVGYGLTLRGDFEEMLRRLTNGRLSHEMLVKLAKTAAPHPTAVDATAGMGEDALLLAAAGYEVTLFEQDAVIAALLRDTMTRARKHPVLGEIVARMTLIEGNSIAGMASLEKAPDIIYLDPMFPARRKSGLINKKLQLLQKLEQPCTEEAELVGAAYALKPKKIIIKRPLNGAFLAGRKPSYTVKGKAIRYDVLVP